MAGWLIGISVAGFFVSIGLSWMMQPKLLRKHFGAAGCRRWWVGSIFIALAGAAMALVFAFLAWYPGAFIGSALAFSKTEGAVVFAIIFGLGGAACSGAFYVIFEENFFRQEDRSPPVPAGTGTAARGVKVTPDEIRAKGCSWPLPGYNEDSFQRDKNNRLDLDKAIENVASSMEFWTGMYDGATDAASAAATVSLSDVDDFKEGRREAAAEVQHFRATLSRLEAIRAEFEPTSSRGQSALPDAATDSMRLSAVESRERRIGGDQ